MSMTRATIQVDDEILRRVLDVTGQPTAEAAVAEALRMFLLQWEPGADRMPEGDSAVDELTIDPNRVLALLRGGLDAL